MRLRAFRFLFIHYAIRFALLLLIIVGNQESANAAKFNCADAYAKFKDRIAVALFGKSPKSSDYDLALAKYLSTRGPQIHSAIDLEYLPPARVGILKDLGWKFGSGKKPSVSGPSLVELAKGYEIAVARLGIPEHQQIRPVRLAKTLKGQYVVLELTDNLPDGTLPVVGELPTEEIVKLLAQGKFPVSEYTFVAGNTFLGVHDQLGHISSYLAHPDLAEALRESAKTILQDPKGWPKDYGSTNKYDDKVRLALEFLTRSRVSEDEMAIELKIPSSLKSADITVSKIIEQDLSRKSDAELAEEAENLSRRIPKLLETLGGANTDAAVFNRLSRADDTSRINRSGVVDYGYSSDDLWELLISAKSRAELESSVAKMKVYLYLLSRTSPSNLVRDILRPSIQKDSDLYRLNCVSQVFTRAVPWHLCSDVTD